MKYLSLRFQIVSLKSNPFAYDESSYLINSAVTKLQTSASGLTNSMLIKIANSPDDAQFDSLDLEYDKCLVI